MTFAECVGGNDTAFLVLNVFKINSADLIHEKKKENTVAESHCPTEPPNRYKILSGPNVCYIDSSASVAQA